MMVQYFLMLVVLLLIGGLAIDVGVLQWRQVSLQSAADAAAVEGMYQLARGDANWATEARTQAAANGYTQGSNNVTVTLINPPTVGNYAGDPLAVQAVVSQTGISNAFMGLVNGARSTVAATATAKEIPTCIWIMNQNDGSNSSLAIASAGLYANCGIYMDARAGNNLGVDGFSSLGSLRTRIVGPSSGNTSSGYVTPSPRYGAAIKMDPLAYVTAPTVGSCNYNNVSYSSGSNITSPGVFCGGLTLNNTTLTLTPGLYIIVDGMTITNSTLIGTSGVTLYFTKSSGKSSYTNVSVNNSAITLKAPTSSIYNGIPGVVVFADRNWVTHGSSGFGLVGGTLTFDGYWYTLNTGLYLWSNAVNYYSYDGLIVDSMYQFGASSSWNNSNFTALGGTSPLHYEDGVLVQ